MKTVSQVFAAVMAFLIIIFILGFVFQGEDFILYRYFAPKREAVRRKVFEETKSYNQGMIQELQNMQFDYAKADASGKKALASIILHRAADFPEDKLPPDLYGFIEQLKRDQLQ